MTPFCREDAGGIYVHIPFCIRKCHYCDFYSITETGLLPAYLNALSREASLRASSVPPLRYDSIYIGGGTPSLIPPGDLEKLLRAIHDAFNILPDTEITLEVNPGTLSRTALAAYRQAGVNRLSIGVQSFNSSTLRFLGRIHTAADSRMVIDAARKAGFENLSLDLIYGLPDQSETDWIDELNFACGHDPAHLSCYLITCEEGTVLHDQLANGTFVPANDRLTSRLFLATIEELHRLGYPQYEISNFSTSLATRSRHNQKYWNFSPYIGLGAGAHSFQHPHRWWNAKDAVGYVNRLEKNRPPSGGRERLTREQRLMEAVYAGLRKREGIDLADFSRRFGIEFRNAFGPAIEPLLDDGHVALSKASCSLTPAGMLYLDSIAAHLINVGEY